ncbi:ethanolamine utilization protein EutQ [Cupriavidus taiwanensis]|uniref:ethanolamine utilization protein EutQ n=1 Tax=Cupriavidus taiwanensis TaxID=164546 RepID=UPI000E15F7B6|nr:ethanolamine utilization protein EutQ [Cupriavidus taiwanensis]SOY44491.1 Ethanolamine utilization protein EutQ [Cupriavidus taiwanensis]
MSTYASAATGVRLVDQADLGFVVRGGPPGAAYVARAIPEDGSSRLGVGFARWEGAKVSWTTLYEEVIFTIEGTLEVEAGGTIHQVKPGQVLCIPKYTELIYSGFALFGYVVYPGNWKQACDEEVMEEPSIHWRER